MNAFDKLNETFDRNDSRRFVVRGLTYRERIYRDRMKAIRKMDNRWLATICAARHPAAQLKHDFVDYKSAIFDKTAVACNPRYFGWKSYKKAHRR